jgi:F0F1-type ATP synthase delta subunit
MSVTRISTISRNYAQALFDSFEDKETIKTQLGDVIDTLNSSYD